MTDCFGSYRSASSRSSRWTPRSDDSRHCHQSCAPSAGTCVASETSSEWISSCSGCWPFFQRSTNGVYVRARSWSIFVYGAILEYTDVGVHERRCALNRKKIGCCGHLLRITQPDGWVTMTISWWKEHCIYHQSRKSWGMIVNSYILNFGFPIFILLSTLVMHSTNGHVGAGGNPATSASTMSGNHVIFPMEAEAFVQELTTFSISDIGSSKYDLWCTPKYPFTPHTHVHVPVPYIHVHVGGLCKENVLNSLICKWEI